MASVNGLHIDTRDFKHFASALRRADPVLNKSVRTKLRGAGSPDALYALFTADAARDAA